MIFLSEHDAARLGIVGAKKRTKRGRTARPDIPSAGRAAPGEGDRIEDLQTLAAAGWTCTHCQDGQHWMSGARGETDRYPSYRAMLDATLEAM